MITRRLNPSVTCERRKYVYRLANSGILNIQRGKRLTWQLSREGKYMARVDPEFSDLLQKGLMKEFWEKYNQN